MRALLEVDLGLFEQAQASADEALAFARQSGNDLYTVTALGTLGRLELARGHLEAAAEYLRIFRNDCSPAESSTRPSPCGRTR